MVCIVGIPLGAGRSGGMEGKRSTEGKKRRGKGGGISRRVSVGGRKRG
jgi:hypothetical protein